MRIEGEVTENREGEAPAEPLWISSFRPRGSAAESPSRYNWCA